MIGGGGIGGIGGIGARTIRGPSPTAIEPIAVPPGSRPGLKIFVGGGGGVTAAVSGASPIGRKPTANEPGSGTDHPNQCSGRYQETSGGQQREHEIFLRATHAG